MMKTFKIWQIATAIIATLTVTSCGDIDEPDGKWDPMIWKTEVKLPKQADTCLVAATGGEFTFYCKNYSKPWISQADYAGKYYNPIIKDYNDTINTQTDWQKLSLGWFKAEITDNQLKVTFDANQQTDERPIKLTVTAGDIFYTFYFKQSANK